VEQRGRLRARQQQVGDDPEDPVEGHVPAQRDEDAADGRRTAGGQHRVTVVLVGDPVDGGLPVACEHEYLVGSAVRAGDRVQPVRGRGAVLLPDECRLRLVRHREVPEEDHPDRAEVVEDVEFGEFRLRDVDRDEDGRSIGVGHGDALSTPTVVTPSRNGRPRRPEPPAESGRGVDVLGVFTPRR
jgi:hypothetical protein